MEIGGYDALKVEKIDENRFEVTFSLGDVRKATSSCWAKVVEGVDVTKENGYAFEGNFIRSGDVVDLGSFILLVRGEGSWKYPASNIYLYKITKTGEKKLLWERWSTKGDKIKAIKKIAEKVNGNVNKDEQAIVLIKQLLKVVDKEKAIELIQKVN